jgi:hypothetical protein
VPIRRAGRPVLRLCAPFEDLPRELCACPDRCEVRQCELCLRDVHYDPKASIPELGAEVIICRICIEQPSILQKLQKGHAPDG